VDAYEEVSKGNVWEAWAAGRTWVACDRGTRKEGFAYGVK
jgi:hypothetical protein